MYIYSIKKDPKMVMKEYNRSQETSAVSGAWVREIDRW